MPKRKSQEFVATPADCEGAGSKVSHLPNYGMQAICGISSPYFEKRGLWTIFLGFAVLFLLSALICLFLLVSWHSENEDKWNNVSVHPSFNRLPTQTLSHHAQHTEEINVFKDELSANCTHCDKNDLISPMAADVGVAVSGHYVGGFCIRKENGLHSDWSYFSQEIPNEYYSNDNGYQELRTLWVAVQVWHKNWKGYHVSLSSQHSIVLKNNNSVLHTLNATIGRLATEGEFTYEIVQRSRNNNSAIFGAYHAARLYKKNNFLNFKKKIEHFLGPQNWLEVSNETKIPDFYFKFT